MGGAIRAGDDEMSAVTLYGAPASLYTAKVRAYLRLFGIPHVERFPSDPRYREVIRPTAQTHRIPVVEFADGEVVQDSTLILDAFERRFPRPEAPVMGPRQQLMTHILESISDRGLTKPAMHYRWNFMEVNEAFVVGEFGRSLKFPAPPEEVERLGQRIASKMSSYLPMLGIDARTVPTIERAYAKTLALLTEHFTVHPFLLGDAPTRADCAMMGPLYGHLARDPYPLQLMQRTAPLVFRWTERINAGELQAPEYPARVLALPQQDAVPPTLIALCRHLLEGCADDLVQSAGRLASWVAANPDARPGDWISPEGADQPALGEVTVDYYGKAITQQALGHSLWLHQRTLDHHNSLDAEGRSACDALVAELGCRPMMEIVLPRRLTRRQNRLAVA